MPRLHSSHLDHNKTKVYPLRSRESTKKSSPGKTIRHSPVGLKHPVKAEKLSNQSAMRAPESRYQQKNAAAHVVPDAVVSTPKACSPTKPSPIKTRLLQKSKQRDVTRCTICKSSKGDLNACAQCHKMYHLSKCMLYCPAVISRVKLVDWFCPRCIRCWKCKLFIDDPTNVECGNCLHAWHGSCKPLGGVVSSRQWFCNVCSKKVNVEEIMNGGGDTTCEMFQDSSKWAEPSLSSQPVMTPLSRGERCSEKLSRRKLKLSRSPQQLSIPSTSTTSYNCASVVEDMGTFLNDKEEKPRSLVADETPKALSYSPRKKQFMSVNTTECFSALGSELFDKALNTLTEVDPFVNGFPRMKFEEQWVNIGGDVDIKVLYQSPYPDHIKSVPLFFVCAYCLKPFSDQCSFFVHQDCCPRVTPPGIEIYRDSSSTLSFFEVDGAVELTYCRNLCLFAMLFISSKTLHIEVGQFLFYILTVNDENGCRIVGYFSKEKNPSRNNNLSCLLTIPSEQRNGYGHLLIDMSYKLSEIERKIGSPEHPLSDLGLYTYRKYWKSSILCYLRSLKDSSSVSIKNMSLHTRIHPTDIVNELMRSNLLLLKDGNYFIKTWRLAYKLPLSMLRRRVVDSSRVRWTPKFDATKLDAFKINHYA
ncbi:hypothetical protein KIN20_004709 [Parelaphostrongylus tenuis]|uniref:Histone acetyltransferase n=1 Tax=Parelaphostrongylus tenuis TaxID=148309 RepID=A0AAD5M132_PARTN|nr:hypothetical protein KIN20_004709 [Parelaphostrongylus tenuis]